MPTSAYEWVSFVLACIGVLGTALSGIGVYQAVQAKREAKQAARSANDAKIAANAALDRASKLGGTLRLTRAIENLNALKTTHLRGSSVDLLIHTYSELRRSLIEVQNHIDFSVESQKALLRLLSRLRDMESFLTTADSEDVRTATLRFNAFVIDDIDTLSYFLGSISNYRAVEEV